MCSGIYGTLIHEKKKIEVLISSQGHYPWVREEGFILSLTKQKWGFGGENNPGKYDLCTWQLT